MINCIIIVLHFSSQVYFIHSYCAMPTAEMSEWILAVTDFGEEQRFVSMVNKGNVVAVQFHPEKSGPVGLNMLDSFLRKYAGGAEDVATTISGSKVTSSTVAETAAETTAMSFDFDELSSIPRTVRAHRIIACLDVCADDNGALVVTKGCQYNVREANVGSVAPTAQSDAR